MQEIVLDNNSCIHRKSSDGGNDLYFYFYVFCDISIFVCKTTKEDDGLQVYTNRSTKPVEYKFFYYRRYKFSKVGISRLYDFDTSWDLFKRRLNEYKFRRSELAYNLLLFLFHDHCIITSFGDRIEFHSRMV